MARPTAVPGLGPDSRRGTAARLLLAARLADVRAFEPGVAEGLDPDAVHDMRVATRRLRAASKLFADDPRDLDGALKRLQDALGAVRDVQVQLAWLTSVERRLRSPERARMRAWIAAPLRRDEVALRRALSAWGRATAGRVEAAAQGAAGRGRLGGKKMGKLLDRRERRLARLARQVKDDPEPRAAHALRIAAKKLRYTAELLEPAFPDRAARLLETLVPLQEMLGELHDADVRIERLERLARRGAPLDRRAARRLLGILVPERERLAARLVRALPLA